MQQNTGCHPSDFPGNHLILVRIPGQYHHFLQVEFLLQDGFQAGKFLQPVHIVPEFLEKHGPLIGDAHPRESKVQQSRFLEEIHMGAEDPFAEPQLLGQGPAPDGLVVADLAQHLIALRQKLHHFRNQFIL